MNRLFTFIATALIFCAGNQTKVKAETMDKEIKLVQDWDKTFPKSEKVKHEKVTFKTQYGLLLQPTSIFQRTLKESCQPLP